MLFDVNVLAMVLLGALAGTLVWVIMLRRTLAARTFALQEAKLQRTILEERLGSVTQIQETLDQKVKLMCHEALNEASGHLVVRSKELIESLRQETSGKLTHQKETLQTMLAPFEKALKAMHENIHTMEKTRAGAYEGLVEQVKGLSQLQGHLQAQTGQLLQALRTPNVRGQWGEIQLRRLVEWSGMLPFCDFLDQKRIEAEERMVRPDLIINLPLGRTVVVDAKAPLQDVLDQEEKKSGALAGGTAARTAAAKHLKLHIQALSKRNYARYVAQTPDFVLLFLPTEGLLIKALEADASLMDYCTDKGVLLATPMTLIALLKTIALGWHQQSLSVNAQKMGTLARDLSVAFKTFLSHMSRMGKQLKEANKSYQQATQSIEDDLLPRGEEMSQLAGAGEVKPTLGGGRTLSTPKTVPKQEVRA